MNAWEIWTFDPALEFIPPSSFQRKIGPQGNRWWKSFFVPLNVRPERPMPAR